MRTQNIIIGVLVVLLILSSFIIGLLSQDFYHEIKQQEALANTQAREMFNQQLRDSVVSTTTMSAQEAGYQKVLKAREEEAAAIKARLSNTSFIYEVKKGDTLDVVARLFGVSKQTIITTNKLNSENLTAGSVLIISNSSINR